jgi:hypothetical protein
MTNKTTESHGKKVNRAQKERSFKRLSPRSAGHLSSDPLSRVKPRCGGFYPITFLLRRYRSNDAPSVLRKDSCIFGLEKPAQLIHMSMRS